MTYIFILVLVSGVIAYMGDYLGTYVGKKRLTIFGLRPRNTAPVVTVFTGITITLLTLFTASIISEDVKIALFHLDSLKKETSQLANERDSLKKDIQNLENNIERLQVDIERLKTVIEIKETGNVVFRKDEPLAAKVIKTHLSPSKATSQLTDLIIALIARVRDRGVSVTDEITFFEENRNHIRIMAEHISNSDQELVVAAVAGENINAGESLGNVRFLVLPNDLIFNKNQDIASIQIDGSQSRGIIARALKGFMDEINQQVVNLGMIANPLTGKFGDLSSDSMISFYDMVNSINALNRNVVLTAFVTEDTYAIGPLDVSFRFEESNITDFSTENDEINYDNSQ